MDQIQEEYSSNLTRIARKCVSIRLRQETEEKGRAVGASRTFRGLSCDSQRPRCCAAVMQYVIASRVASSVAARPLP